MIVLFFFFGIYLFALFISLILLVLSKLNNGSDDGPCRVDCHS